MKYFVIDIETKFDKNLLSIFTKNIKAPKTYKDPEKIKQYIAIKSKEAQSKMAVDTDFLEVLCVGVKEVGGEAKIYTLKEMEKFFEENKEATYITFNGKGFDFPALIKSGLKNKLKFPYKRLKDMSQRFKTNGHYDLMLELSDGRDFKSLDTYLQIYLGISKKPVDFGTATDEEIEEHCLEDLENTEKLYTLFKPAI